MPSGAECYRDAFFLQEMIGTHHVVAGLDLMVDMLDSVTVRWKQRDRMMHLIDAQQRCIADTVGDAGIASLSPELLVAGHAGRTKAHMTKSGNPGVAASSVAPAGMRRPIHPLNAVTAAIHEASKAVDA